MFEAFKRFIPLNFAQICRFSKLGTFIPPPIKPDCDAYVWNQITQFFTDIDQICKSKGFNRTDYSFHFHNYFLDSSALFGLPNEVPAYPYIKDKSDISDSNTDVTSSTRRTSRALKNKSRARKNKSKSGGSIRENKSEHRRYPYNGVKKVVPDEHVDVSNASNNTEQFYDNIRPPY